MGGRFGSVESEMETESRHPVHHEEAPASFRRAQLIALLVVIAVGVAAFLWMILR